MMEVGHLLVRISADLSGLQRNLDEAKNKFEGLKKAGEGVSDVGKTMTTGITLPIMGAAMAATHMSMNFNAAMADFATLIPGNAQRVEELKTVVQDMAVETGKRTGDLARGLYQVVSAFGDTADTARILETNARAAAAGLATTEEAIALTSAVTKGYGDTSAEAVAKASDLALLTVRLGQTTFPELAGSIGRVTPLASAMGVEMEDLFATMATLTGVTGSAAEVSTQLRGVLQGLMDPSEDMQKALAAMGYESGTLALESLGLQGVLQGLAAQTGGNKEQLVGLWGQVEAGVGVLALTGGQADAFGQRLQDMQGYAGTTGEAFAEVTDGVNKAGFEWQQMRSQLEVTAQRIGDLLAPALMQLMEYISQLVTWFSNLDEEQQKTILTIAGIAAAIGPLLLVTGHLMQATAGIMAFFTAVKTGAAAANVSLAKFVALKVILAAKILAIIAVIALLAYGVYMVIKHWDAIKAFFANLWEGVKTIFAATWEWIKSMFLRFHPIGLIITHWQTITAFFRNLWAIVTGIFNSAIATVRNIIQGVWNFVSERFSSMVDRVRSVLTGIIDAIAAPFRRAREIVGSITGEIRDFLNRINPFARSSPSLVDNVRAGVRAIQSEYAKLERLQLPAVSAMMPQAAAAGTAGPGMTAPGISAYHGPLFTVQNMTVRSDADIEAVSRSLHRHIQAGIRAKGGR